MTKLLLFVVLSFVSFLTGLQAQQQSKGYLDSTKDFFKSFSTDHPKINNSIIVDDTSPYRRMLYHLHESFFNKNSIFKILPIASDNLNEKEYPADSIIINHKELKLLVRRFKESKSFKFHQEFFPDSRFATMNQIDSIVKNDRKEFNKYGCWTLGLPVFLRRGKLALCYYQYYCGGDCGYEEIVAYQNKNGHWKKYGSRKLVFF